MAQIDLFKIKLNGDSSGNSGGGECPPPSVLSSVTFNENGTYTPTAGVDGYNSVTVDVAIPQFELEEKSVTITENGTQTITPTTGYDGLSEVSVTVNVATSGGSTAEGFDFSVLGYNTTLNNKTNDDIQADIDYSKRILDNWNPSTTSASSKFANSKMVYAPNIDTSNVTNMTYMFQGCELLKVVPELNTNNVRNMTYMFIGCTSLTTISQLNTINVTNMDYMFRNCENLTTIPLINTSNVISMGYMFDGCKSLTTIPAIDTTNVTSMGYMFSNCSSLETIPQLDTSNVVAVSNMFKDSLFLHSLPLLNFGNVTNISTFFGYNNFVRLTELGGFKDLKIDWSDNTGLYKCPNLTYQSVMNVINNLYDFRGNGDTTTTKTIKFNANSIALLSESDIAIATNKGWVIS